MTIISLIAQHNNGRNNTVNNQRDSTAYRSRDAVFLSADYMSQKRCVV